MSTRERAKDRRRLAIADAARALMSEEGDAGFSMRALAVKAGVSLATPYNLFGSKQEVIFAVMADDVRRGEASAQVVEGDELEVFFNLISLAKAQYREEPNYNRALLLAVFHDGGQQHRLNFGLPLHILLKNVIERAISKGYLHMQVNPGEFAISLGFTFLSCALEWANQQMSLEEFELRVHYGFALALSGLSTGKRRDFLLQKIIRAQNALIDISQRNIDALPVELKSSILDQTIKLRGNA
ncbi:MAG: TetR/AcrR family transcriptional regulator [Pseudomonadales bacterium]|jgi:AcrR family transcriptional regulator